MEDDEIHCYTLKLANWPRLYFLSLTNYGKEALLAAAIAMSMVCGVATTLFEIYGCARAFQCFESRKLMASLCLLNIREFP